MSHNWKRPASILPRERREEKGINLMASVLQQESLDTLLEGSPPAMRQAMLDRLLPLLSFVPAELATPDCPACGMHRGSVIAHECSA